METDIEAATPTDSSTWPAAPLTRALELIAERCGLELEPREAWEAAAEGIASGRGDALRSLGLAARRARLVVSRPGPLKDLTKLRDVSTPTLTWMPGPSGGRWLVVLGGRVRGRKIDVALLDEEGERRLTLRPDELSGWLERECGEAYGRLSWLRAEPLLPLAKVEARAISGGDAHAKINPLRRLVSLARLDREDLGVILVYAIAVGGLSLAAPVAVQALVNTVAFGSVLQPLVVLSLLLAIVLVFVAMLRIFQALVVEAVQRRLFVRTATDFARRLPRLSSKTHCKYDGPELANRFFDVVTLQKAGASLLIDGLALVLQMIVGMALLAFYHPMLLAFDLIMLIGVAVVVFVAGRGAITTAVSESDRKFEVAAWLEGLAGSPLRFADARSRAFADARAEILIREWLRARRAHFRRVVRQLAGGFGLQVLASTLLLGLGGWLVIRRQLTLGQLVAAELVVATIGYGLGKLGKHLESLYDASAAAAKLGKVVDADIELGGGELLMSTGPFAVTVRRRDSEGATLLALAPGEKLVLHGRTPDNSSLCDELFGMTIRSDRDVRIDGCSLRGLDLEAYRAEAALVRGLELVAGSIRDNLDPRPIPSDAALLHEVLDVVNLDERIALLPDGLLTPILPNGAPLSEAEARRLVLATAMLRRPRLLVIDGGLDGLGLAPEDRKHLLDHLFAADAPWTLIVISEDSELLSRSSQPSRR